MGQARPGGGIGLLISPTGSSLPDPLQAATKQFTAKTPEPCWLTGTKAPNKRRSWLAAPAPLQYARADQNSHFLAQVTNPQAFVTCARNWRLVLNRRAENVALPTTRSNSTCCAASSWRAWFRCFGGDLFGGSLRGSGRLDPVGEISKPNPPPGRACPISPGASYAQEKEKRQ